MVWLCQNTIATLSCKTILGYIHHHESHLKIKLRLQDLWFEIKKEKCLGSIVKHKGC